MTREIDLIVVHCSATPPEMDIGADLIRKWHVEENGWSDIGYHKVVKRDGTIEDGRPASKTGAHAKGFNARSLGICLVGGIGRGGKAENNFTPEQFAAARKQIDKWRTKYGHPLVIGHGALPDVSKACPSFDAQRWYYQF